MFIGHNFKHNLLIDYKSHTNCAAYGCDEICRCRVIKNENVKLVYVKSIVNEVMKYYFDNTKSSNRNLKINSIIGNITPDVELYTIDRILRINKIFNSDIWDIQIVDGYYGQEVDDVILREDVALKIETQLSNAFEIFDLSKRIEYLLILEYGRILPELKDRSFEICEIERDKIYFGSDTQKLKVSSTNLSFYSDKDYNSIRGLVIQSGENYRLIDGYHRCLATENRTVKVLLAT